MLYIFSPIPANSQFVIPPSLTDGDWLSTKLKKTAKEKWKGKDSKIKVKKKMSKNK